MRLIEKYGMLGIDKAEVDELIAAKNFIGLNRSPREEKIIVSLTSYKPRINDVKYTIYSLLNQSLPPDKLILWLDEDSFPQREENLPPDLLELRKFGLTIDWCENLRSYKKLIPALEKFPEDIIVTADDDIFYQPDWLKILYEEHIKFPDCLIAHYGHRMRLNTSGEIYPRANWHWILTPSISLPPKLSYSFGTGGGVLLKRSLLHPDVMKRENFLDLAPIDDELWVWAMAVLNGTKTRLPLGAINRIISVDIDTQQSGETLWSQNKVKKDFWLRKIVEHYPAILYKLIREAADFKPYLSVVVLIEDAIQLNDCLQNIFAQKFPDFELIVINCGSRVEVPILPTNFRIINYPGGNQLDALNFGLRKASGDYVLFKDEKSFLAVESLDLAAQLTTNSQADVIHFARHFQLPDRKILLDDAPELQRNNPTLLDTPKQIRAALWLQNKLSKRLDTKIFKREFLKTHGITFNNDAAEFMFGALTSAEKYLIVPQPFAFVKE